MILGGASPIQKRTKVKVKGQTAGKHGIKNTATKRGRGGFSKAGKEGVNIHGYGVNTRFQFTPSQSTLPSLKGKTGSGGDGKGTPGGGDTINYFGDVNYDYSNVNNAYVNGVTEGTSAITLPSYKTAWDAMTPSEQAAHGNDMSNFITEAEKWWQEEADKKGMTVSEYKKWYKGGKGGSSSSGNGNVIINQGYNNKNIKNKIKSKTKKR